MKQGILTIGLGFGDEAKGSFIQYLQHKYGITLHEKYNGGCQGKHSILHDGKYIPFSQLSVSMIDNNTITILGDNFVFEPFALKNEIDFISKALNVNAADLQKRIFIDKNCVCVTPIHKLYNRAEEDTPHGRGSVGTGVSIAGYYKERFNITLTSGCMWDIDRIKKILERQQYFFSQLCLEKGYVDAISSFDTDAYVNELYNIMLDFSNNVVDVKARFHQNENIMLYESSQGFLLDRKYGLHPNTTLLDVSADSMILNKELWRIGFIRSIYTRHGKGCFPSEDEKLNSLLTDETQEIGIYSGKIRFGWFDCVLFRYAIRYTCVDEVYMSHLDYLSVIGDMKICTSYIYHGDKSFDEVSKIFDCLLETDNTIVIKDILFPSRYISLYLNECIPILETVDFKNASGALDRSKTYISRISQLCNVKISLFSFGPDVRQKIEL